MSISSDVAELTSVRTQLDELRHRIATLADTYRTETDMTTGTDLFNAERALITAARSIERAARTLEKAPG